MVTCKPTPALALHSIVMLDYQRLKRTLNTHHGSAPMLGTCSHKVPFPGLLLTCSVVHITYGLLNDTPEGTRPEHLSTLCYRDLQAEA